MMCIKDSNNVKMMCTMFNTAIDKFNFVTKGLEYWFEAGNIKKAHADYG